MIKSFKDFNIKPKLTAFTGDKIKIERILNTEITVNAFKIEPSKAKPGTMLLTLQITKSGTNHIVFTGSSVLMDMIQQVTKEDFPFTTTIIKESEHLEFT